MNDNTRTGKRTKSRTKELEENDDDEDDSERRKYTIPNVFEINGNSHEIDTQHNSSHGQHSDQVDNCRYNTGRTEYEGNVGNANTIPKDFSKANREISTTNEQMTTKPLDERHNVNINIESVDTNRIVDNSKHIRSDRSHGQCPNECEYWGTRGSIARDVKNSYWHCSEVESYERKQNTHTPCTGNNINRMESSRENGFCEARETYRENPYCEQNCIYLPFENVTKDRSCFRKNCACHQKYLTKHMNLGESCNCSSKKKTELLLSPSSLSRSNDNYEECSCRLSNCCDKQSDYNTIHSQYRRTNKPSRTCGHREKRKSNHFKDKVNQVLPNVMASFVTKHRLPENQRRSCNETCLNSCDNCNQYNGSIVPEPNPVNSDSNRNNSLVPNGSLVPENRVPCQTVNSVCNSSNNLQPMSPNAETPDSMHVDNLVNDVDKENVKPIDPDGDHLVKRKETLSDVKEKDNHVSCSDEKFLDIKIKLNPDRLKEEGSASHTTCITESVSEQNSVESHLQSALIQPEIRVTESTTANESEPKGEILEVNKLLDVPTSSKYLTSPLRNNRRKSNREQRPKSIPERKIRKQFYTPYEEALSSLLWQPYDCRNNALANMEVSDMSDSEDQTKRNVHRTRRKSGLRSTKHDRQDHRLVGSTSMHSYVLGNTFDNPPEYGMMENFQSFAYDDFFSACNPSLLCRNCKINLFVEDDDEFRGKYFCFNCKELKRFLYESNPEDDLGRDRTHFEKRSYGSLDGACGMTYPDSVSSGILSSNQMIPQIYLKHNVRPKHHSKQKHVNELGKKPKHNQDNDTCSSTLSSSYSSTSSLSSLECSPPGALLSSGLDRGGSGTQPAQFSAETCRVNVDQSLYFHSDTSLSSQTKISKPGSTYNVDSKMLVNISNSNHNLSLSQSNLLSNSQNNLISVVTNNPSVSASDNNHISNSQNNNGNSENLVNIVSCYRPVPVVTVSSSENNHVPSDNPTYTNSSNQFASSSGPYPHHGGGSGQVKSVNRCVSSVSVPAGSSGLPPPPPPPQNGLPKPLPTTSGSRTFISTEAQTDEIILSRDQRRRERRERRQQRRLAQQLSQWPSQTPDAFPQDRLPDILHSHVPPPYSTLPLGVAPCSSSLPPSLSSPPSLLHPSLPNLPPASHCGSPIHPAPSHSSGGVTSFAGIRFPFTIVPTGRRRSRLSRRGSGYTPEEEPKTCCGVSMTIRWFISIILVIGVLCVVIGCILGTMNTGVRQHVSVSLLMIGVGIILVTVSGLAWRLSVYRDESTPTWRMLLGLGGNHSNTGEEGSGEPNRRFVPRLPPSYGRPHHPYAAMMYPEFQFRPPPPSYQASMQEYRLRLLLLDRQATPPTTVSPPPTYRSHSGSLLRAPLSGCQTLPRPYLPPTPSPSLAPSHYTSRPPSYRSRPPSLHPGGATSVCHSRDSSDLSDSRGNVISVINTEAILKMMDPNTEQNTEAILKMMDPRTEQNTEAILRMMDSNTEQNTEAILKMMDSNSENSTGPETIIKMEEKKDLVTVVENPSTQVIVEAIPCEVEGEPSHCSSAGEMHILAHL